MFARSYGGMSPGIRQQGGQLPDIESQMREQRGFGGMANPPRMPPQTMPPQGMINDLQSTVGGIPGASLSQSPPNQGVFGDIQNAISSRSNNAPPDLASVAAQQSGGLQTPGINGFNPRGGFGTPMGGGGQMLGGIPGAPLSQSPPNQGIPGFIGGGMVGPGGAPGYGMGGGFGGPQMVPGGEAGAGMAAPDMSGGGMQAGGFGGGLGFNGLGKPQENKYDRFANAMMQARSRRGMGGRPMAKPMLGGMGGPMTRPQAPRGGMQQSPPIVPQQMTNDLQSAVQGLQQKPGRLTQPGSPVLTAPAGFGAQ